VWPTGLPSGPLAHGFAHGVVAWWLGDGSAIEASRRSGLCDAVTEMLHVRLIGRPRIETSTGDLREVRGQKPWAVLARVVLADRPLMRRELSAELFPEAADPLGSLRWCLAGLRKALGAADVLTGDPIGRDMPASITVDVHALWDGVFDAEAVGELLEGVEPRCGPEFSTWLLVARQQVASRIGALLREETITALARKEYERAIGLAELAARRTPFDEGAHVLLVKSLALAGHDRAALTHVTEVERSFRAELGEEPSPALRSAARAHLADPPPGVSPAAVATTLLESGRAALSAGACDAGLDCLRRAGAQAESAGDDALLARCLYELGSALVHAVRGFDDEGTLLLGQAVQLARTAGDVPTAVSALRERGYADALAGRRPEAQRHLDLAGDLAGDDAGLRAGVHAIAGFNLADWGRLDEGLARYQLAIDCARHAGDRRREAWVLGIGAWALLAAGRVPEAVRWVTDSLTIVQDLRWVSFEPWPSSVLAEAALADGGDRTASPADLERCFALSCQLDDPCWEGGSGRVLALHHARRGDDAPALRWIAEARTRCIRKPDIWAGLLGAILLTEAELRAAVGDVGGAEAASRDLVALAARAHLDGLLPGGLAILSP
jgi:DNA-binding SARP family transcriptional activator